MFIRLRDAKTNVNMLLSVKEILAVKDYIHNGESVIAAKSIVFTRPTDEDQGGTHNYFVEESLNDIEALLDNAIDRMFL